MSLSKVEINRIDAKTKLCISGYVRQSASEYVLDIPDPLILIILAFFHLKESFQKTDGDGLEISQDGLSITRISKDDGYKAYGTIDIDPKSNTRNVWKIKIDQRENAFMVGLMAIKADDAVKWLSKQAHYMLFSQSYRSSLLCSGSGHTKLNDDIVNNGDIITIELDLSARKVIFSLNDKTFESNNLSSEISDDESKYYLVCRVGRNGNLGHQMSIMEFFSCDIEE